MTTQRTRRMSGRNGTQYSPFDGRAGSLDHYQADGRAAGASEGTGVRPLAKALGWFSLGLGLAGVARPDGVARVIGVKNDSGNKRMIRLVGLREIAQGVGILRQSRPTPWLWSRVGGDMIDLAYLQTVLRKGKVQEADRAARAMMAVAGVTLLDVFSSVKLTGRNGLHAGTKDEGGMQVRKAITVKASPEEVYSFWRDFRNLPRFMSHLESVEIIDDRRSRWRAKGPVGAVVEWEAEITDDRPGYLIAWRSLEGADVDNAGRVRFKPAPGGRGTEIIVELRYDPPAGKLGAMAAKLFGKEPGQEVAMDLRRFKQVLETGEVIVSDATVAGLGFPQRPAQPPAPDEVRHQVGAAR